MTLALTTTWQRTRAILLHDHFRGIAARLQHGSKLTGTGGEIFRLSILLKGKILSGPLDDEEKVLDASPGTLLRAWNLWRTGNAGKAAKETPEALLLQYKPGCGGKTAMPRELKMEIQRRSTLPWGGRDKHKKAPISVVMQTLKDDFKARRHIPGIDYALYPEGADFPFTYRTVVRHKPSRQMRVLGNVGVAAHRAQSAYISMDYSRLRKGEMYTLDDVRLDVLCMDEKTGQAIQVVIYILMEVGSRAIVAYVMKPRAAIRAEDVDELLALGLQTRGFGIGIGYKTHIYFEQGTTACSEGAQGVLESMTASEDGESGIQVHRIGMITGVRWIGSPADKASGNAAAKGCIESFNRWLHFALLNLPGQRGNHWGNTSANLGHETTDKATPGSLRDQAQRLAEFKIAAGKEGQRVDLRVPMLYFMDLHQAVREAIQRHNTESGHAYRGHGTHHEAEVAPGVWQRQDPTPAPIELPPARNIHFSGDAPAIPDESGALGTAPTHDQALKGRDYKLSGAAVEMTMRQKNALYWSSWNQLQKANGCEDNLRFALTRRVLGKVVKIKDMTPDQFRKVLHCFEEVLSKSKTTNPVAGNQPF